MTKQEIMIEAVKIADKAKLYGLKRWEYLNGVRESEVYKNAPEKEITTREQLQTEVRKTLDEINFLEFLNHPNRKKK